MGNQLDRITHLSYSELPTGDPSGLEKDELRVGVAYFFSDEEDEGGAADDRTPSSDCGFTAKEHSSSPDRAEEVEAVEVKGDDEEEEDDEGEEEEEAGGPFAVSEVEYTAFCARECIFSKLREHEDLSVYSLKTLLAMCKPGDLLELVAAAQAPHWAVYERGEHVIHLHRGEIRKDRLLDVGGGRRGRIVNNRYRYRPLPHDLVMQNAASHVGLSGREVCWNNSESFAAWCRFGKREFKAGGEAFSAAQQQQYFLKVHLSGSGVHTLVFRSLEDMIRERRRVDASGILKELSLVSGRKE